MASAVATRSNRDFSEVSTFGGKLEKAKFICYPGTPEDLLGGTPRELPFFLNPSTIHMEKEMKFEEQPTVQTTTGVRYAHTDPICLSIGELWFDTYDTRKSVREEYIDELESLADYDPDTHYPRTIVFHFGVFSARTKHQVVYTFFLSKLSVDYTMFLCDGTPVRAKVSVSLKQLMTPRLEQEVRPKQSPDHARIYTVKRGDTLQRISTFAYGSPSEWRRIADSNHLDDPMSLRPGAKLVLPPILR
ncbi:MAG: LysM peptidoglycan-binding domain-containing protein [Myxococcota bacterium]